MNLHCALGPLSKLDFPSLRDSLYPGAHVIAVVDLEVWSDHLINARLSNFEIRDTFFVVSPTGSSLVHLLRKPCTGSVVDQVLGTGTGALNIGTCSIPAPDRKLEGQEVKRWPSNLIFILGADPPSGGCFKTVPTWEGLWEYLEALVLPTGGSCLRLGIETPYIYLRTYGTQMDHWYSFEYSPLINFA